VFELKGYHYFNSPKRMGSEGSNHVRRTLITNLMKQPIALPDKQGNIIPFLPDELGLKFPLLLNDDKPVLVKIPNPDFDPETMAAPGVAAGGVGVGMATAGPGVAVGGVNPPATGVGGSAKEEKEVVPPTLDVLRHDFIVQVVWQPNSLTERLQIREEKRKAAEEAEQAAQDADAVATVGN
jgi:type IV pilus assembly protein PilM